MATVVKVVYQVDTKALDKATAKIKEQAKAVGMSEKEVDQLNSELKKTATVTKQAQKEAGGLNKAFGGVARVAATALAGIGFANAIKGAVDLAAVMEQNRVAFTNFTGSAESANKLLGQIEKFAASTPFQFPDIVEASKKLLAFGIEADRVVDVTRMLGDISAGTGKDLNELSAIFGKIRAKGKAQGEELIMLAEAGLPIYAALQKELNISASEVEEFSAKGKLSFDVMEKAMRSMTEEGGLFFNMTKSQSETTAGKLSTLRDNVTSVARGIGESMLPAVNFLTDAALGFFGANKSAVQSLMEERAEINSLVPLINDASVAEGTRARAMERINELSPKLLEGLSEEELGTEKLTDRLKKLNEEYETEIRLTAARAAAKKEEAKVMQAEQAIIEAEIKIRQVAAAAGIDEKKSIEEQITALRGFKNAFVESFIAQRENAKAAIEGLTANNKIAQGVLSDLEKTAGETTKEFINLGTASDGAAESGNKLAVASKKKAAAMKAEAGSIAEIKKEISDLEQKKTFITDPDEILKTTQEINKLNTELLFLEGSFEKIKTTTTGAEIGAGLLGNSLVLDAAEIGRRNEETFDVAGTQAGETFIEAFNKKLAEDISETEEFLGQNLGAVGSALRDVLIAGLTDEQKEKGVRLEDLIDIDTFLEGLNLEGVLGIAAAGLGEFDKIAGQFRDARLAKDIAALETERDARIAAAEKAGKDTESIEAEFTAKREALEKEAARKEQAIAVAQAIINTALGVTKALANLPPPFNFIEAAAITAAGAAQIATIRSQGFKEGGYTGDGSRDQVKGHVHAGEWVFTASQTAKNRPFFEAFHKHGGSIEEFIPRFYSTSTTQVGSGSGDKYLRRIAKNQKGMIRRMDEQIVMQRNHYARANGKPVRRRGFA